MQAAVAEGALFAVFSGAIGGNLLTAFLLDMGATNGQIGLLNALGPLTSLSTLFAAYVLTHLPRRKPFMVGMAFFHRTLWALAGFIPLLLPSGAQVWAYLAVYFAANLGISLAGPAWQSIMADTVAPDLRGRYFGLRNAVVQVATMATVLWAGRYLDAHPGPSGFRTLYLVALGAGLLNVGAFLVQPEPPYIRRDPGNPWRHLALPFRSRPFLAAVLFTSGLSMAGAMVSPFYTVQMLRVLHLNYGLVTQLSAVGTATAIAAHLGLGRLVDRAGEETVLGLLPWLSIVPAACWFAVGPDSVLLLYLISVLQGVIGALQSLVIFNVNLGIAPRADRPVYLAAFSAVSGLGGFVAPVLGGAVAGRGGLFPLLWLSIGAYLLLGLVWQGIVRPRVREAMQAGKA
ncbi:MFS family permease [Symbiobacterium terraclitae]|uniref:MFS family permease n=1 Tax=Symbiobacterium terraclitae TaxID=557451 RepID=A0ABS4JUR1_9FIRM|nr:MFS transporter [Symbiobacterium terraclitae]MBP2019304.1 MFS family permease [Symbiobacterium terraclitae]